MTEPKKPEPMAKVISGYSGDPDSRGKVLVVLTAAGEKLLPGTDLFDHPSVSRMKLEIEVANENALQCKSSLEQAQVALRLQRKRLDTAMFLLGQVVGANDLNAALKEEILEFSSKS